MTATQHHYRALIWLAQAQHHLEDTDVLISGGRYAAAAFWARQGAELAVKSLHYAAGNQAPRHNKLCNLVDNLPAAMRRPLHALQEALSTLDDYLYASRYPDVHDHRLTPAQAITSEQAQGARDTARRVIDACRKTLGLREYETAASRLSVVKSWLAQEDKVHANVEVLPH